VVTGGTGFVIIRRSRRISWSLDSTRVAVWVSWGEEPRTIGVYGLDGVRQTLLTGMPP
jgi:hypothetical protein